MTARKTRAILAGGLSAGLVIAAAACSSGGGGSSGGGSGPDSGGHITIGVAAGTGPANALLAQQLGYFKSAGLDISFKPLNGGGAEAVAGMQSGSLQIAESNVVSVIQGAQHGIKTPCFTGGVQFRDDVGTTLESDKTISQPGQLAGKSIGVVSTNSANTVMIDAYLDANGVDYKSVHYVATGTSNTLAALESGSVQGAELVSPYSRQYLADGGHLLVKNFGPYVKTPIFACWTAQNSWLSSNGAAVKKFVAALNKADTYYYAHPSQAAALIKGDGLKPAANMPDVNFTYSTAISDSAIQTWIDLGKKYGVLTANPTVAQVYQPVS
jgi:NitT/TauT family transport system substrate-binding protein